MRRKSLSHASLKALTVTALVLGSCLSGAVNVRSADTSGVFSQLQLPESATPVPISGVEFAANSVSAGALTSVRISYVTPDLDFPFDYKVGVTLPDAFDFDTTLSASFTDDSPAPDPDLRSIEFIDKTVVFRFRRTFFAPKAGQRGIIRIDGVKLPERADGYTASAFISDTAFLVLAGPGFSNSLEILPGPAVSLEISPKNSITVAAGATVMFEAVSRDVFGNVVSSEPDSFTWRFADEGTSLGTLQPGLLLATSVGENRVVVSSAGLADTSGLITASPGPLARLELEIEQPVFVGAPLCASATVTLYDGYNNVKDDDELAGEKLQLSVSSGTVTPDVITIAAGSNGVIDLQTFSLRFDSEPSTVSFRASIGAVESATLGLRLEGVQLLSPERIAFPQTLPAGKRLHPSVSLVAPDGIAVSIDSVTFSLPEDRITIRDGLTPGVIITADESQHLIADAGASLVSIESFARFFRGVGFEDPCPSVNRQQHAVEFLTEAPVPTAKVDTLIPGMGGTHYGFGFSSGVQTQSILSARLEALTNASGWVEIASLEDGVAPLPFSRALVDSLPLDFGAASLEELIAGELDSRLIVTLEDGWFSYVDTVSGSGQVFLREKSTPFVVNGSFAPVAVTPGAEVQFEIDLGFGGAFGDSVRLVGGTLGLTHGAEKLRSIAQINDPLQRSLTFSTVTFPLFSENTVWDAVLSVSYDDAGVTRTSFIPLPSVSVGPVKQIVFASISANAPNFPHVNTDQSIPLDISVRNNAPFGVDSVFLRLLSNSFAVDSVVYIGKMDAGEERQVALNAIAPALAVPSAEIMLQISSAGGRIEDSSSLFLKIERPALIQLSGEVSPTVDGREAGLLTTIGKALHLSLRLVNSGAAEISSGTARVSARGGGLQIDTTVQVSESPAELLLGVTGSEGSVRVTAELVAPPLDLNVSLPAALEFEGAEFFSSSVAVVPDVSALYASVASPEAVSLLRGETITLAEIELTHVSPDDSATLRLETMKLIFTDPNGNPVDPDEIIEADLLEVFLNGGRISFGNTVRDKEAVLTFGPNQLAAGESIAVSLRARLRAGGRLNSFRFNLPLDAMRSRATSGIETGRSVVAKAPPGAPPREEKTFTLVGAAFSSSFLMRENPFNPDLGANAYSYSLSSDARVALHIYTLTGKEVYRESFTPGGSGGRAGVNQVFWDGRNGDGRIVRDGVYILRLTNENTGESVSLKQAVVR